MMHDQTKAREEHIKLGFLPWEAALLGEKQRGSRIRVTPVPEMLKPDGYVKQVKVLGELADVWFDANYVTYHKSKSGIDWFKLWHDSPQSIEIELNPIAITEKVMYDWLSSQNLKLDSKLVRHGLMIKFQKYLSEGK